MTAKKFRKILEEAVLKTDQFTTDPIDMKELSLRAKNLGFDSVMVCAGKDDKEIFNIYIQKI